MTISEMHIAVKLDLDKTSALDVPAYEPEEIDFWLNRAIRDFVKTRYSGVNFKKESFEQTQKRTDDLRTLVDSAFILLNRYGVSKPNSYRGSIEGVDRYWLAVGEEADIVVNGTTSRVGVTQCTQDEYRQKIDDPYSEHILHYGSAKPLRLFYEDQVELTTDGNYTVNKYYLTYIKEPVAVSHSASTDCDLPGHTHDEVVKLAVNMMLENIEQPRQKTHSGFVATME
jgi:hypothetical protein